MERFLQTKGIMFGKVTHMSTVMHKEHTRFFSTLKFALDNFKLEDIQMIPLLLPSMAHLQIARMEDIFSSHSDLH